MRKNKRATSGYIVSKNYIYIYMWPSETNPYAERKDKKNVTEVRKSNNWDSSLGIFIATRCQKAPTFIKFGSKTGSRLAGEISLWRVALWGHMGSLGPALLGWAQLGLRRRGRICSDRRVSPRPALARLCQARLGPPPSNHLFPPSQHSQNRSQTHPTQQVYDLLVPPQQNHIF